MSLREKLILFLIALLLITTFAITSVWYHDSNILLNSYVEETASSLMKDAYNAFSYLLTDADYLSSLVVMNRENIITPLQIINAESMLGHNQLTYNQLINKRLIDSYIGLIYGHKYYITGISVVSTSGHLFKSGETLYYSYDLETRIKEYNVSAFERRMVLLPPVEYTLSANQSHFIVPAVRSITSSDGNLVGHVIIYLDYLIIRDMFSNNLPLNSTFQVKDKLGNMIFSNIDELSYPINSGDYSYVRSHYYAERVGWDFNMAIPTVAIKNKLNSTIRRTLFVMFIITLIASTFSILVVYRMTRNLEKLNQAMQNVSLGNLNFHADIEGRDEIGRMGKIFNSMLNDIKNLLKQITIEEKQKRKTEIDFLQAQINPHFVSNTLNTIVWMAKVVNADNISSLAKSLNTLMQSSMRRGEDFILIKDEIDYTKNYVEIQKYASFYDFEINYYVDDELLFYYSPRFLLQPLVENAIIHGFSEKKDSYRIEVSVSLVDDSIQMVVFDTGKGIRQCEIERIIEKKDKLKNRYNSIGIKNIQERIKLFFGNRYGIYFESEEDKYTKAIITIPLLTRPELVNHDE